MVVPQIKQLCPSACSLLDGDYQAWGGTLKAAVHPSPTHTHCREHTLMVKMEWLCPSPCTHSLNNEGGRVLVVQISAAVSDSAQTPK